MADFSLAKLDDATPAEVDPAVWSRNVAALRQVDDALADTLETTHLPAHFRPVIALDGAVTFRTEQPGRPAAWLAGTALPRQRAEALLPDYRISEQNATFSGIGAGCALGLVLERLPAHKAVFVFERDWLQLAAVLHIVDCSNDIERRRVILLPPNGAYDALAAMLGEFPGLLPPGNIFCSPVDPPEHIASIRDICERINREIAEQRSDEIGRLAQSIKTQDAQSSTPELAIIALSADAWALNAGEALRSAAADLNDDPVFCALRTPVDAGLLVHCRRLAERPAPIWLCVDCPATRVPLPGPKTICQWHLRAHDVDAAQLDPHAIHLAASPSVETALQAAKIPADRILPFYWACPADGPATGPPADAVVLCADLPDDSHAAVGIDQPTHQVLWAALRKTAEQRADTADIARPETLLRTAERACGVQISERTLRDKLLRIIQRVLIPAVVVQRIVQTLESESFEVLTIGKGWSRCRAKNFKHVSEDFPEFLRSDQNCQPMAAIFAGGDDPFHPALPMAGALAWPLCVHIPAGTSLTRALGRVLAGGQHVEGFSSSGDLRTLLNAWRGSPKAGSTLAQRARGHLLSQHTYARRLEALLETLAQLRDAGSA